MPEIKIEPDTPLPEPIVNGNYKEGTSCDRISVQDVSETETVDEDEQENEGKKDMEAENAGRIDMEAENEGKRDIEAENVGEDETTEDKQQEEEDIVEDNEDSHNNENRKEIYDNNDSYENENKLDEEISKDTKLKLSEADNTLKTGDHISSIILDENSVRASDAVADSKDKCTEIPNIGLHFIIV